MGQRPEHICEANTRMEQGKDCEFQKVIQMRTCSDVATHVIRTELLRAKPLEGLMGWGREVIFGDCCPSDATCNDSRNGDDNDDGEEPAFWGEIKASPMSKAGGGNEDMRKV